WKMILNQSCLTHTRKLPNSSEKSFRTARCTLSCPEAALQFSDCSTMKTTPGKRGTSFDPRISFPLHPPILFHHSDAGHYTLTHIHRYFTCLPCTMPCISEFFRSRYDKVGSGNRKRFR